MIDVDSTPPWTATSGTGRSYRVLLAEDDQDVRNLFRCALLLEGFEVAEAKDGVQLLTYIVSSATDELEPPSVIVTDVVMPGFSGLDALKAVQRSGLALPVILMTGYCDAAMRAAAREHGAAALLVKPVTVDQLLSSITAVQARFGASA